MKNNKTLQNLEQQLQENFEAHHKINAELLTVADEKMKARYLSTVNKLLIRRLILQKKIDSLRNQNFNSAGTYVPKNVMSNYRQRKVKGIWGAHI
ncbi:MAG: hypothetical protein M1495_18685 [Bacteroidetes bacterium]|nr:hypothetical protein [Bacteroidota bacterium]